MLPEMTDSEFKQIMHVLMRAFIEIRASKNLDGAKILADIFHNVPAQVSTGHTFEEVRTNILSQAERHDVRSVILKWFDRG